jgi:hypothetical protein
MAPLAAFCAVLVAAGDPLDVPGAPYAQPVLAAVPAAPPSAEAVAAPQHRTSAAWYALPSAALGAGGLSGIAGFFLWFAASGGDSRFTNLAFGLSTAGAAALALGVWGIWWIAHQRNVETEPVDPSTAALSLASSG